VSPKTSPTQVPAATDSGLSTPAAPAGRTSAAAKPTARSCRKFEEPADGFDPFAAGSNARDYLGQLDPSGEAAKPDTHAALADIRPRPGQPPRHFGPAAIEDLARSIEREGLINPITVRPAPSGDGYELLAGERRFRALSLLAGRICADRGRRAAGGGGARGCCAARRAPRQRAGAGQGRVRQVGRLGGRCAQPGNAVTGRVPAPGVLMNAHAARSSRSSRV
jgi:hypothetical protein